MSNADIYSRSHRGAANILKNLEAITAFVGDSLKEMGLQIELLDASKELTTNARADVNEAISRLKGLPVNLGPILEQILTDLDVIGRGLTESAGLAKQTRGRLSSADEYLIDVTGQAQNQVNLTANIQTLAEGREYLATRRDVLKRVIELAGAKVVKEILEEVERGK